MEFHRGEREYTTCPENVDDTEPKSDHTKANTGQTEENRRIGEAIVNI